MKNIIKLLLVTYCLKTCICQDPIVIVSMLGVLGAMWSSFTGKETCSDQYIRLNMSGLNNNLQNNLYGQHLVLKQVTSLLKEHLTTKPAKALVLSFNGPPGTGKNLVSSFIANNMFQRGVKSQFFHLYHGGKDFQHVQDVENTKRILRTEIEKATSACPRNLFIFDEVDKMVPGVLDVLSPYIDFHEELDGVDYRGNTFIFISNAGSKNITSVVMKFLESGKKREEITSKDVEYAIARGVFHEKGGLHHSDIINRDRIDLYVPFFPLEKTHIKACIQAELKSRNVIFEFPENEDPQLQKTATDELVEQIADELIYVPEGEEVFARTGCRTVKNKVELFLHDLKIEADQH